MDVTAWRRGIGILAAVATIAASATYAHAAGNISVKQKTPATSPGSNAVFTVYDDDGTNKADWFQFKIYYNPNQATPISAAPTADTAGGDVTLHADDVKITMDQGKIDDGLTRYVVLDGYPVPVTSTWTNLGDLADVTFQTNDPGFTGTLSLQVDADPTGMDFGYGYIDGASQVSNDVTYSADPTPVYSSPVITSLDKEGTWTGQGQTVTVSGTGFFDGSDPGEPTTVFTLEGVTLAATINSETQAQVVIPAEDIPAQGTIGSDYVDLDLTASNGIAPFAPSTVAFTVVERDNVYVNAAWSAAGELKRVAPGRIIGANAYALISDGTADVNQGGHVKIAAGNYEDTFVVAQSKAGVTVEKDGAGNVVVTAPGSASDAAIATVQAADVTIDGLYFNVNQPNAVVGILLDNKVAADNATNLTVTNSRLQASGTAGSVASRGIAVLHTYPGAGTYPTVNLLNNKIGFDTADGTTLAPFDTAVIVREGTGQITGNDFCGIEHDLYLAWSYTPLAAPAGTLVQGNNFLGWGNGDFKGGQLVINEPNSGEIIVDDNDFNPQEDVGTDRVHVRSILVSNIWKDVRPEITNNRFDLRKTGILIANSNVDQISGNEFTPVVGATGFVAIELNNKPLVDDEGWAYSNYFSPRTMNANITGNTIHAGDGVGIAFRNHNAVDNPGGSVPDNGGVLFDNLVVSGNTFDAGLTTYIDLDGRVGSAQGSGIAGYADLSETTMAPFPVEVALGNNTFGTVVGITPSTPISDIYAIEDKIIDGLDKALRPIETGIARLRTNEVFVTQLSNSIQRGVDKATGGDTIYAGDTIHVQAGTYDEYKVIPGPYPVGLYVDKKVTLLGPKATTPGADASRGTGEAVIRPGAYLNETASLDTGHPFYETRLSNWHPVVNLTAAGTTFAGFRVVGENPDLDGGEGPVSIATMNLAAATGILAEADEVEVVNNIVDNFSYIGIWSAGYYASSYHFDDIYVANNLTRNVHTDEGYGYGYYIGGSSGLVENNHAQNVRTGMNIQPYDNNGVTAIARGNHLQAWKLGLWYNYTVKTVNVPDTTPWTLEDNHITAAALPGSFTPSPTLDNTVWSGIVTQTQYDSAHGGTIKLNTVDGTGAPLSDTFGIRVLSSIPTPTDNLVFEGNTIQDVNTGVYVGIQNTATYAGKVTLNNNNEIFNTVIGVDITAFNNTEHDVSGNNIHDNVIGIRVRDGGVVDIANNTLVDNERHLAFEATAANEALVNGYNIQSLSAGELELIVAANPLTAGKTYLAAGMGDTQINTVPEFVGGEQFVNVRSTIQGSIDAPTGIAANNTVKVMTDTYSERVVVNKTLRLQAGTNAVIYPDENDPAAAQSAAVYIQANLVRVDGFLINRDAVTGAPWGGEQPAWGNKPLHSGIAVHAGGATHDATITNNHILNYLTGVYLNDTQRAIVTGNKLDGNRFGVMVSNNITGSDIRNNTITNNVFAGIAFLEPNPAVVKNTTQLTVRDNNISGNTAYDVLCDWVAAKTDVLDLSGNYFGNPATFQVSTAASNHGAIVNTDPATLAKIANVGGIGAQRLIDYNAYLATDQEKTGAPTDDLAFQGDFSELYLGPSALAGTTGKSHINDALALLQNGFKVNEERILHVTPGIYDDSMATVETPVQIVGTAARELAIFNPRSASQGAIEIRSDDVTIANLTIAGKFDGTSGNNYGTAINRSSGVFDRTVLDNIVVRKSGAFSSAYAVNLGQPEGSVNSTGNVVKNCLFDECGYAGVALLGGETDVIGNTFQNSEYQGLYVAPDGNSNGGTRPVARVAGNTFKNTPAGVRFNTVASGSYIGTATSPNTFYNGLNDGTMDHIAGVAVSVEYTPAKVENNDIHLGDATFNHPTYGEIRSIGAYFWGTSAEFTGNTIVGTTNADKKAVGVLAVGERTGALAGIVGSNNSTATNVTITGNTINGLLAGVAVANASAAGQAAKVTVNSSNTIEDCTDGVRVDGINASAIVSGNTFNGNDNGVNLVAATASPATDVTGNTFGAIDTSAKKYIANYTPNEYDVSTNTFDSVKPSTTAYFDYPKFWAIQEGLEDGLNETGYGYLRLTGTDSGAPAGSAAKAIYVPAIKIGVDSASNGLLTRANEVAIDGEVLQLQGGTYGDAPAQITKHVGIYGNGGGQAHITQPMTVELNDSSENFYALSLEFNGAGNVTFTDAVAPYLASGEYAVQSSQFVNVTGTAITVAGVSPSSTGKGTIQNNTITDSNKGIVIEDSTDVTVQTNQILDNFDTGIEIWKGAGEVTGTGLSIVDNTISGLGYPGAGDGSVAQTGANGDSPGSHENGRAYGIFVGLRGGATAPSVTDLDISLNTVKANAGTGVALWHVDGSGPTVDVTISQNTIEQNGLWRKDDAYDTYSPNTDGLKLKHSKAVTVAQNFIRENVRSNVTVEGSADNSGQDVVLTKNHLEKNQKIVVNTGEEPSFGAGLLVQLESAQAATTTINADDNWWGHVYGPSHAGNLTGRGTNIITNGGLVDADSWYGQRDEINKWFALNDQDGDGVLDADEDMDLDSDISAPVPPQFGIGGLWGEESRLAVKDTDGDGYEDGAEVKLGSDPLDPNSTPADPAGDGSVPAHPLAPYANYMVETLVAGVYVGGDNDSDGDRYLDFYEVGQGTDPTVAANKPTLGLLQTYTTVLDENDDPVIQPITSIDNDQVLVLRRIMVGSKEFTDPEINQDNGDLNRDGVVNNADLIFLRRKVMDSSAFPVYIPDTI